MHAQSLKQLVRDRRLELEMTQKDLEAATGIEQSYLSHIETGRVKRPGRDILDALSTALALPVESLVLAADHSVSESASHANRLSDDDVERVAEAVVSKMRVALEVAA